MNPNDVAQAIFDNIKLFESEDIDRKTFGEFMKKSSQYRGASGVTDESIDAMYNKLLQFMNTPPSMLPNNL